MRQRILIVADAGEAGGMEKILAQIAQFCVEGGSTVRIVSIRAPTRESYTRRMLDGVSDVSFYSTESSFRTSWGGRLAAGIRILTLGRIGGHWLFERYRRKYWNRILGRTHVRWADRVLLIAQPLYWFARIPEQARAAGVPLIMRLPNYVPSRLSPGPWYREFIQYIDLVDAIQVHGRDAAKLVRSRLQFKGTVWEIDQYTELDEQLLALPVKPWPSPDLLLGTAGRIVQQKGINQLLEAVQLLRERNSVVVRVRVAGDGPYLESMIARVHELGLSDQVQFAGNLDAAGMVEFFRDIDVLVHPSWAESGPLVGVEAMAAGVPIVATRVGSMEHRIGDFADEWLVPPKDVEALYAALKAMCHLPADRHRELSARLRSRYLERHTRERIRERYQEMLALGHTAATTPQ